jgi:hypothetical protein
LHIFLAQRRLITLNTSDVSKYKINWNGQYLIYSDKSNRDKIAKNEFPNLKNHLDKYADFITSSNKPYGIHRDRSSKINPFEEPKLICKSMFKKPEFAYDDNSYYVGFSFSVIWQMDKNYDIKFLLGLLNSNFGKYWFTVNGKKRGIGVQRISCSDNRRKKTTKCDKFSQYNF